MPADARVRRTAALPRIPWLPPSVRRAWRDLGRLQLGVDPDRATVLDGADADVSAFIAALDGSRTLREHRSRSGLPTDRADQVLHALADAGYLVDLHESAWALPARGTLPAAMTVTTGSLVAELAGRALGDDRPAPLTTARRRAESCVLVVGGRIVPGLLARLLAGAGVGRVVLQLAGPVTAVDIAAGEAAPDSTGRPRATSWQAELTRAHPGLRTHPLGGMEQPDLVVLCDPWPGRDDLERTLQQLDTPYLCATVRERRAVVGPLVLPGVSSCLRCQHLHRVDADPGWAAVDAQLRSQPQSPGQAGEMATAGIAAALAGVQALQWIDGEAHPESVEATLDIALPDLRLHRRHWALHPECGCGDRLRLAHLTAALRPEPSW